MQTRTFLSVNERKQILDPPLTRSRAAVEPNPNQAKLAAVLPSREVAGVDGLIRVHVPFLLSELSHIEQNLGSYISNSTTLIKQFQYITQFQLSYLS